MSHDQQSATEVAEDYRQALEDLSSTNRADISTLTTIARENTEHAQTITEVLQKHILRAPAHKKLPAIYVLDSIVKNVGTPYTLFFGAQMFQTFMEAYAAVDSQVRRKMEETLQTWKQPVPQSLDDRPVFPPDVTRPIEESLIKARTSALAAQARGGGQVGLLGRGRGNGMRATPTPPGQQKGLAPPQMQHVNGSRPPSAPPNHSAGQPVHHPPPQSYSAQPGHSTTGPYQPPSQAPRTAGAAGSSAKPGGVDIEVINRNIQELIEASKVEFGQNPNEPGVQQRLKGLLELQGLLRTQDVPPDQLALVKIQVDALALKVRTYSGQSSALPVGVGVGVGAAAASAAGTAPPVSYNQPPVLPNVTAAAASAAPVISSLVAPSSSTSTVPQAGSVTLDSLLGKGALASLLARSGNTSSHISTLPSAPGLISGAGPGAAAGAGPYGAGAIRSPQPKPAEMYQQPGAQPPQQPLNPAALLAGLRKAGLLTGGPPTGPPPTSLAGLGLPPVPPPGMAVPPMPPNLGALPGGLASLLSVGKPGDMSLPVRLMDTIQLDAKSLKNEFRPHLLPFLYDALGPQCTQCGRRFSKDEEGRKKKTAHMDWHFQVHRRLAEAEKRGQHRSWYVDLADWVKSREVVDADHHSHQSNESSGSQGGAGGESGGRAGAGKDKAKAQYVIVPDSGSGVNVVCPICQEKFENTWLDLAQEWVWMDTMMVGSRAYHSSCYEEATRAREGTPARGTPEPVLGKRKAEDELKNTRKMKVDA